MNSTILIFACLIFFNTIFISTFAQDCDKLNKIALKCINRELNQDDFEIVGNCSDANSKERLIDYLMQSEEFIGKLILIMRLEFLQGTTIDALIEAIQDFDLIMFTQPDYADFSKTESEKLYKVYHLEGDFMNDSIGFEDIYVTYFNNWAYDQQNMGIDNFINSTFAYSLGRPPTKAEKRNSSQIISGEGALLFYKRGNTKLDYLNILTGNDNFYEKQIKYWHYFFLNDYPDHHEVYKILSHLKMINGKISISNIIRYLVANKI